MNGVLLFFENIFLKYATTKKLQRFSSLKACYILPSFPYYICTYRCTYVCNPYFIFKISLVMYMFKIYFLGQSCVFLVENWNPPPLLFLFKYTDGFENSNSGLTLSSVQTFCSAFLLGYVPGSVLFYSVGFQVYLDIYNLKSRMTSA